MKKINSSVWTSYWLNSRNKNMQLLIKSHSHLYLVFSNAFLDDVAARIIYFFFFLILSLVIYDLIYTA